MIRKSGQVWVETVLYTLIGLVLIGVALAIITPQISKAKDTLIVEQTINALNDLDKKFDEVFRGPGNVRQVPELTMRRGELYVNATGDEIIFVLKGMKKPYSEPGVVIEIGSVDVLSEEEQKDSTVYLTLDYGNCLQADLFFLWIFL